MYRPYNHADVVTKNLQQQVIGLDTPVLLRIPSPGLASVAAKVDSALERSW
jgi:hypothetical protein